MGKIVQEEFAKHVSERFHVKLSRAWFARIIIRRMHFWAINGPEYLQRVIWILPVLPTLAPKLVTKENWQSWFIPIRLRWMLSTRFLHPGWSNGLNHSYRLSVARRSSQKLMSTSRGCSRGWNNQNFGIFLSWRIRRAWWFDLLFKTTANGSVESIRIQMMLVMEMMMVLMLVMLKSLMMMRMMVKETFSRAT